MNPTSVVLAIYDMTFCSGSIGLALSVMCRMLRRLVRYREVDL